MNTDICLIFDLDGTLVDSEGLCSQAFLDLVPALEDTVESLTHRYRGQKLSLVLTDIEQRIKQHLPAQFETAYRQRVAELLSEQLKPMPNVIEMLENTQGAAICVASNGPLEKTRLALQVSGLAAYFDDRIFSSYQINAWKPDPKLFQYAASYMGYPPEQCIVVEDSDVGIQAAIAAKMLALQYRPDTSIPIFSGAIAFHDMAELPMLIRKLSVSE